MWQKIQEEPVFFQGFIQTVLALAIAFGLPLTGTQVGAVLAVTAAFLSWWTRKQVTPVVNPKAADGTRLIKVAKAAASGG